MNLGNKLQQKWGEHVHPMHEDAPVRNSLNQTRCQSRPLQHRWNVSGVSISFHMYEALK